MTDIEQRAHDLAIVHILLEIKEGHIRMPNGGQDQTSSILGEYKRFESQFKQALKGFQSE